MRRHVLPMVAAAAVASAAVACSGSGEPSGAGARSRQARDAAKRAGLAADVQDLLAMAARGASATFTATYDVAATGSEPAAVSVVQRPPERRVEVRETAAAEAIRVVVTRRHEAFTCSRRDARWACRRDAAAPAHAAPLGPSQLDATVARLTSGAATYNFAVETRTIAGAEAWCLMTTRKPGHEHDPSMGERGELCVARSGVPGALLLVDSPNGRVRATSFEPRVDPAAFDLPAPPNEFGEPPATGSGGSSPRT